MTYTSKTEEETSSKNEAYLRLHETKDGDWELQSSQVTYCNERNTCEIDLIATVHVGEKEYYANLERELRCSLDDDFEDVDDEDGTTIARRSSAILFELLTDEQNVEMNNNNDDDNDEKKVKKNKTRSLNLPRLKV